MLCVPTFIDGHEMVGLNAIQLKNIISSPPDKHGVTHKEILYNEKENKLFCILDAPNKESIKKHHQEIGVECDFIIEATLLRSESISRLEKLSAVGEMSARIVHDLKNPLGIIKNAVELIEISPNDNYDESLKKKVKMIRNASERMSRQINNILDFVRTRPLQLEKKSLLKILESSLESKVPDSIKIIKPQNDVEIQCDGKQLEVVFNNIIVNAVEAIENSGEIKVSITDNQSNVKIEIENSGKDITQDDLEKIFDPLFTTKSSGTGLGLASCKNIVEQHGGSISVSVNPTIFEILLPKK
jgi:two-component system sensor histidine kinase HydH